MQGSEISVHGTSSLVPPSQSQNCWGGIQPLLLQCLRKCCELPASGTLLFLQHCFLFGSLSLEKHVTTHDVKHYAPSPDALAAGSLGVLTAGRAVKVFQGGTSDAPLGEVNLSPYGTGSCSARALSLCNPGRGSDFRV